MRIVSGTEGMPAEPILHKVRNQFGGILRVVVVKQINWCHKLHFVCCILISV